MKVIILGKGTGWEDAPFYYGDENIQTWGLNNHIMSRPFDLLFEPHDLEWYLEHCEEKSWFHKCPNRYKQHIEKVNELGVPYLTQKKYDFLPTSQPYPVEEICEEFGIDLFGGGIDYMVAYAIYKKAEAIDIYGVHTEGDTEWEYQKPSLQFWVGVAVGRGIPIVIHGSPTLLKTMYHGKEWTYEGKNADGLRYGYFTPQRKFPISQ